MEITIESGDSKISDRETKKIRKLTHNWDKHLKGYDEAVKKGTVRIEEGSKSEGWIVSFDMWLPEKYHVYSKAKNEDLIEALSELEEQVTRQIEKYKEEIEDMENAKDPFEL